MAIIQIPSLECDPGSENDFGVTDTYQIQTYTDEDWDGELGNLVYFYSGTPGTQATIDLSICGDIGSASNPLEYMSFVDILFTGGSCYANFKTCTGKSNNTNGIIWIGLPKGGSAFIPNTDYFLCECGVI